MNCTIRVAKTKALISFAVTAKLICAFVFTYADCWFSHAVAHIMSDLQKNDIWFYGPSILEPHHVEIFVGYSV